MRSLLPFLALMLGAAATAQTASLTTFGAGCPFNGQTPAIGNRGLPQLGQTFAITYTGPNFTFSSGQQIAQPWLGLGFTLQQFPIPTSILPQQPAGCLGLIGADVLFPAPIDPVLPQFVGEFSIAVPNHPSFLGVTFHAQWLTLVEQCGFAGCGYAAVLTSDAATVICGV